MQSDQRVANDAIRMGRTNAVRYRKLLPRGCSWLVLHIVYQVTKELP